MIGGFHDISNKGITQVSCNKIDKVLNLLN